MQYLQLILFFHNTFVTSHIKASTAPFSDSHARSYSLPLATSQPRLHRDLSVSKLPYSLQTPLMGFRFPIVVISPQELTKYTQFILSKRH
jgi:hypothetical protein